MKAIFKLFRRRQFLFSFTLLAALSLFLVQCKDSDKAAAQLEQGFLDPPDDAKPRVWWHWLNGNVTEDGIRKDLEWMSRSGVGGFQNFNVGMSSQMVEERLLPFDQGWKDAVHLTVTLADSLGLEMAEAASPGWSESGGPWVTPKEAMKKYVWSETRIEGGKLFFGQLQVLFRMWNQPAVISGTTPTK